MNFSTTPRAAHLWRTFAIALLMLLIQPGHAMVVPIDGSARVGLVLVSESTIVCSTEVTPNPQHELFGLDARTGRLQWRAQTPRILAKGVSSSGDTFLLIAKDVLQKRSLVTGKVLWSARLDTIPQQVTKPRKKLRDYADDALEKVGLLSRPSTIRVTVPRGTPSWYVYQAPLLTGTRILVSREANRGGGCIVERCFEDWLVFDDSNGTLIQGGSGGSPGRTRTAVLVGDDSGLSVIANGRIHEAPELKTANRSYWSCSSLIRDDTEKWSLDEQCAFQIFSSIGEELVLYHSRTGKLRTMRVPSTRTNHQCSWVLLQDHILRYPECVRYGADKTASAANKLWFELYDWDGNCIRTSEAPMAIEDPSWSWISFEARSTNALAFTLDGRPFTVALPSLTISGLPPVRDASGRTYIEESQRATFRNIRYEAHGSTNMYKMTAAEAPHDLTVSAHSAGKLLWQHIERVTVKRAK